MAQPKTPLGRLSKAPLVLVLGQVRFSPIRQMAEYIPGIQEEFRRLGFPIERAGKVQQLTISPAGFVQHLEQDRWEYRTKDESWSVLVFQDSVVVQTTSYERFESFGQRFSQALRTVLEKTEHDKLGIVQRVGLRYVDAIQPSKGEDYRTYLQTGFHGVGEAPFQGGSHRLHVESVGQVPVSDVMGTMIIRVTQNSFGWDLPPDVAGVAPKHSARASVGETVTLIDMDHFIEGTFEPKVDWITTRADEMHRHLIDTFQEHVVTHEAIEAWR